VTGVGPDVDASWVGRRVLSVNGNGTYAEYFTAAAPAVTVVPDGVSAIDAVAVGVQASVALALLEVARLAGSEVVLVEAAGGGVGGYLVQLAREFGAVRIIATAGSKAKRDRAEELGADATVDHSDPYWTDRVRDVLNGSTLDVAFESIGGTSAPRLLDMMTSGSGRMVYYGQLAGPADIAPADLMLRALTIVGCGSRPGDYLDGRKSANGWLLRLDRMRGAALDRLGTRRIRPLVDCVLPLPDAAQGHRRIEDREAIGKVILTP
jgi:NADPH:quinone reductase-like Zn-dependent oxidoreductase